MVLASFPLNRIMEFKPLENAAQLDAIRNAPGYHIIFKHNTTCPISKGAYRGLERDAEQLSGTPVYLLDLLANRDISDAVAEGFGVPHQSPQLLVISNGACTYNEALYHISAEAAAAFCGHNPVHNAQPGSNPGAPPALPS